MIQKAIDKFISSLVNRLYISLLCLKIDLILYQYSSSIKIYKVVVYQMFNLIILELDKQILLYKMVKH